MASDYDIAIVGCGPAGATCARLLSERFRVLVIDKKSADATSFKKPCGGLLSPDAQRALSQFDLTLPKDILVDPQIFAVKTIDLNSGAIRHYPRSYLNLDRHKFDLWLAAMIPPRVEQFHGCCTNISRRDDHFHLQLKSSIGEISCINARYVVGADGANSLVRRSLFPGRLPPRYVAIQQWFTEEHSNPFYSCVFDRDTSDCCSWSICKDNYFIFGGVFTPRDCRANFERQKDKLSRFGFVFGKPLKTEACVVLRPGKIRDFYCGAHDAFLIGESAGLISPSSLEGISWGIESGRILAEIFNTRTHRLNRAYWHKTRRIRLKLIAKLFKCPFLYQPLLRKLVMASRINSINISK